MLEHLAETNLVEMRKLKPGSVHLICTTPPPFGESWAWSEQSEETRDDIKKRAKTDSLYKPLNNCLEGFDSVLQHAEEGEKGGMRSYLAYLAPRFAEMYRLLTPNGSLYYVDDSERHFSKCMFDSIFDQINKSENMFFRRDIVLQTPTFRGIKDWEDESNEWEKMWCNNHSFALYYVKDRPATFNAPKKATGAIWNKDNEIYETIVLTSSNEGDTVLDPFCVESNILEYTVLKNNRKWTGFIGG